MKKRHIKMLGLVAQILPDTYLVRDHTEGMKLYEAYRLQDGGAKLPVDIPILDESNGDTIVYLKGKAFDKINHLRRLKKAYGDGGEAKVKEYILWVRTYNEAFKARHSDIEIADVPEGLIEAARSKAGSFWKFLIAFLNSFLFMFKKDNADD